MHRGLRALWVTALTVVLLVGPGAPAWAHTSLTDSSPANLSRLDSAPSTLRLEFSDPVDPATVRIEVLDAEGNSYPGATRTTAGPATTEVEFNLPRLDDQTGTYGITWQSIGRDGHRASGEVVFGVGQVSPEQLHSTRFQAVSTQDRAIDAGGAAGRFLWYLGLSLAAGSLFVLVWMSGAQSAWTGAGRGLWTLARRWLLRGLRLAILGAAGRMAATVAILAGTVEAPSAWARIGAAVSTPRTLGGILVVLLLAVAAHFAEGVSSAPYQGRGDPRWRNIAGAAALAVLAGSVGGHLATNRAPEIAAVVSAAHIIAAALWIGPLALIAVWLASAEHREAAREERAKLLAAFFPRFAKLAGWSLLVLVVTGAEAMWANLGTNLFGNRYGLILTVKIALILVVVLPLAWAHDKRVRYRPDSLEDPGFIRGLRMETAVLAAVLVLASSLALLNPATGGAPPARDLPATEAVDDVAECADLAVGQSNCYRAYFSALMRSADAGVAVARVLEVAQTDSWVATQCHQITHDLGREAATYYQTLGEALSFEASACWSGYYHGVVEQTMSGYSDAELLEMVPSVCSEAADIRYSFTHYNCVHGVGHGIMLRFDADLFASIPYCEQLSDEWELRSCVSGAFMQNVVSAQEGHQGATFREDDLIYPCNEVEHRFRSECFGMQTSYILWQVGQDLATGFAICDTVEAEFAGDCYQSMGRDISGNFLLDPVRVVEGCNLGGEALRERCIVGASLNAVFNDHDTRMADELCRLVDDVYLEACLAARDRAAASFR